MAPRQPVTLLFTDRTHVCNLGVMYWPHDTNRMSGRGNSSTLTTWRRRRLWRRNWGTSVKWGSLLCSAGR